MLDEDMAKELNKEMVKKLCEDSYLINMMMVMVVALIMKLCENSYLINRPCTTVRDSEDILEQSPFQKYTTCWVFLALYFAFAHLTHGNIIFDTLEQSFF